MQKKEAKQTMDKNFNIQGGVGGGMGKGVFYLLITNLPDRYHLAYELHGKNGGF